MPFDISIPRATGEPVQLKLNAGDVVFVLGPNGSGKSTLMTRIAQTHREQSRRLSAHRQNWWSEITLTPTERRNLDVNLREWDSQPNSRWQENAAGQRPQAAILDLLSFNQNRARDIAAAVDLDDITEARRLSRTPSPIAVVNDLFRLSNISISIEVSGDKLLAVKAGSPAYAIHQLSDGERNALLLAATVLTSEAGSLILIDEPERHLHRSITSPLLKLLFAQRPDCSFVISTHDVTLPAESPQSRTILMRGCRYAGTNAQSFDIDVISSDVSVDEQLVRDILGARRTILFVEGGDQSLDKLLYSLVFPNVSVISKGSCTDVEHAVEGVRGAKELHWVRAVGIVDGDRRPPADVAKMKMKGVFPISVLAIESVYYHTNVQRLIAERQSKLDGSEVGKRLAAAKSEALKQIAPHVERLSRRVAERAVRDDYFKGIPGKKEVDSLQWHSIPIHIPSYVDREKKRLDAAIAADNLDEIIQHYPVRTTPALEAIAFELGLQDRAHYEAAVRKLLLDDASALALVKGLFGEVVAEVS